MESDVGGERAGRKKAGPVSGARVAHVNVGKKGGRQSTLRQTAFLWWGQNRRCLGLGTPFPLPDIGFAINSVKPIPSASAHHISERLPHISSRGTGFGKEHIQALAIRKIENI
jgi:hypothetical protein